MSEPAAKPEGDPPRSETWMVPLLICIALVQTTLNLSRPLISYRVIALGGNALAVGLVTGAFAVLPLIVAMPLGRLSDRRGHLRPMLLWGTALFVMGPVLLSFADAIGTLAVASAVLGLAQLVLLVSAQATIARWSRRERMDRGFGLLTASVSTGQLLGPLAAGFLLGDTSGAALMTASRHAFWAATAISLLAVPFTLLVAARTQPQPIPLRPESGDASSVSTLNLLRRPGVPAGLFASLSLLGAADILTAYLPLIGHARDIAPSVIGVLLALRAGATICSRLLLDRMLTYWRHATLVVASAGGSAIAFALVPMPFMGLIPIAVALLVGGFLLGVGQPLTMGIIVRAVPQQARSSGLALRLVANRLGQVALPAVAGLVAGSGGGGAIWLACAMLAAASATSRQRAG